MDPLVLVFGGLIFITLFYVIPIMLGLKEARKKNRSTSWMWFAIYPIGGWITYFVLRASPELKTCSHCGEKAKVFARVCPYCRNPFDRPAAAQPVQSEGQQGRRRRRRRGRGRGRGRGDQQGAQNQ